MRENPVKHFVAAFLIAVIGYLIVYHAIEHRRTRKGPWLVTFRTDTNQSSEIIINQPWLGLTNVQIHFQKQAPPQTNTSITLIFRQPRPVPYEVPFGKCIFMDTTFLPGTVTFKLFEHEIELLPRILIIDHEEHRWRSETNILVDQASGH